MSSMLTAGRRIGTNGVSIGRGQGSDGTRQFPKLDTAPDPTSRIDVGTHVDDLDGHPPSRS